jgi:Recombinase.
MIDHQFLIDEEEEQIVLRIFSMYLSGKGFTSIANTLSSEGVKTPTGLDKWSAKSVRGILMNEKYCGDLVLQKKYHSDYLNKRTVENKGEKPKYHVTDAHDPIIDRETFVATQEEISRRNKVYGPKKPRQHYIFSGIIRCSKCHNLYVHIISAPHTKYEKVNWICGRAREYGKSVCSSTWRIPEDILIQKSCEVLEIAEFSESILRERVKEIISSDGNELTFTFKDGSQKTVEWHHKSRRESWTEKMREDARKQTLARNERRRKNGSKGTD